jgi:hypothetical protein
MIKLINILQEIIDEGIVKVPQEVLSKSKEAYDYISKNLENLKQKSEGRNFNNPYIDSKFKDYFQFKDLKNQDLKITIGFYNDPKDVGSARMDTNKDILLINLPFLTDFEDFEEMIEHELVHAMDPKLKDIHIYRGKKLFNLSKSNPGLKFKGGIAKKGAEPTGSTFKRSLSKSNPSAIKSELEKNYEKYIKSPWEFDAFTAPLVNKLVSNIKSTPSLKNTLINLLSDIKSKNIKDIMDDKKYEQMPYIFSKKEWKTENFPSIQNEYHNELYKLKIWSTKPTLYKRFTSRLGKEIA